MHYFIQKQPEYTAHSMMSITEMQLKFAENRSLVVFSTEDLPQSVSEAQSE